MVQPDRLEALHALSIHNRALIARATTCGCFYCTATFRPSEITEWVDPNSDTALCPRCGIDSVLPDPPSGPVTPELLESMRVHWFEHVTAEPILFGRLNTWQSLGVYFAFGWVATLAITSIGDRSANGGWPSHVALAQYALAGCGVGALLALLAAHKAGALRRS